MIKNLLIIAILTTLVIVSWIIFTVIHSSVSTTIPKDVSSIIAPIPASFDKQTIDLLKTKKVIPADIGESKAIISPTIQPSTTPNPILDPLRFEEQKNVATPNSQLNL